MPKELEQRGTIEGQLFEVPEPKAARALSAQFMPLNVLFQTSETGHSIA